MDASEHGGWAEKNRRRKVGREEEEMVALDLAKCGDLDAREPRRCARGESSESDAGVCGIERWDAMIDQFWEADGQCFGRADIASGACNRTVPGRLRFKCKEHRQ